MQRREASGEGYPDTAAKTQSEREQTRPGPFSAGDSETQSPKERLETLHDFRPSGDPRQDAIAYLKLTNRDDYLPDVEAGKIDPLKLIGVIRGFRAKELEPGTDFYQNIPEGDPKQELKTQLWREIPQAEIAVLDNIMSNAKANQGAAELAGNQENDLVNSEASVSENPEIQEHIVSLVEKTKEIFDLLREKMLGLDQQSDEIYAAHMKKLLDYNTIRPDSQRLALALQIANQHHENNKKRSADVYALFDSSESSLLSLFETPTAGNITQEWIALYENSLASISEKMNECVEKVQSAQEAWKQRVEEMPEAQSVKFTGWMEGKTEGFSDIQRQKANILQ